MSKKALSFMIISIIFRNQEDNKKLRLTISMAAKKMLTAYDEGKGISVINGRAPVKLD